MEETHFAIGFYKNERRFMGYNPALGTCVVTTKVSEAMPLSCSAAAVAALLMGVKFNLAHCRAVAESEAMNVQPS